MTGPSSDSARRLRTGVYAVLIALAAGNLLGRLMAVNSVNRQELEQYLVGQRVAELQKKLRAAGADEGTIAAEVEKARPQLEAKERRQRPFLSANDRSRWLTVRALVEHATFAIDEVLDPNVWNTIDMVRHRGLDGLPHLYSSKPPLFSLLLAGEYWVVRAVTGWTLVDNPYEVDRLMLLTVNVLPMLLMLALVAGWAERFGTTDWGRIFVVAAAAMGTLLTSFAVVLNNHLVGAVCAAVALEAFLRIWFDGDERLRWYALAGLAAAFAACDELPALSLLALMGVALALHNFRACSVGVRARRGRGRRGVFRDKLRRPRQLAPPVHASQRDRRQRQLVHLQVQARRQRARQLLDRPPGHRPRRTKQSHLRAARARGPPRRVLAHARVALERLGALVWVFGGDAKRRQLAAGILLISVVCAVFFIALRPQGDRNYGGMTAGFRWLFWLAPLWLTVMIPAADRLASSRWGIAAACMLLAFSVLSASYPTWNPWTQPWIYQWLESNGWHGF